MINYIEHGELVRKAQLGDKECLNRLAEIARVHLREYVLRLTLREDVTQDVVQESILEMFKVFKKLENYEKFWSWLDGIAFNKIRKHYGRQWRHKTVSLAEIDRQLEIGDSQSALADMINQELKQIVLISMRELSPRYRAVLTMRCYKDMSYSEIARLMGCTQLGAQSLFYRAKKALAKKLSHHGLGKGYLLTALVLFGKLTASTEAAAANLSITDATLKISAAAYLAAIVTSKTAIVLIATAVITGGAMVVTRGTGKINVWPDSMNAQTALNFSTMAELDGLDECWYFFPNGPDGPVMMRRLEFSPMSNNSCCRDLQNQHANYFYVKDTVYINNFHTYNSDLSVTRLPTDSEGLSRFISMIEGRQADMEYVSSKEKGLLVISKRSREHGDRIWRIDRHFNVLEEEYFQFNWPYNAQIVDNRDQMHQQGWTYFKITGRIDGQRVSGTGRLPFVYATCDQYDPWLNLELANGTRIVDSRAGAYVFGASGRTVAAYKSGSFFKGLGRPWMGLHTINTIRRDAAEKRVRFETRNLQAGRQTQVILTVDQVRILYTIDMEADVIEKIAFSVGNGGRSELEFTYLQEIDNSGYEFAWPRVGRYRKPQQDPPGMLWLIKLINDRW